MSGGDIITIDTDARIGEVGDPPGSRIDGYALPTPEGEWKYALYDSPRYRRQGWPFGIDSGGRSEPEPKRVRVAPDTVFRSWRNEYVTLQPGRLNECVDATTADWAHAYLTLWVRPQELGGIVVPNVSVEIDLINSCAHVAQSCPESLRGQAQMKADRLLAFLELHIARARTPCARRTPIAAHDVWLRDQARA